MSDPRIGRTVDRYRIEALLGRGGFGTVYRARHQLLERPVALKVLHAQTAEDAELVERFLREAKAASAIGSRHIAEVFDAGIAGGDVFLAIELLEGEDLAHRIAARAPMPEAEAIAIGLEILDALTAAHGAGIVHRDLKPANVFLARTAEGGERSKLLDFGISKILRAGDAPAITRSGEILGTPLYMAPEQLRSAGEADARADLWSWGAILYEMLSGRTPYEARSFEELVVARLSGPPRPLEEIAPQLSAAMRRLIADCLALEPRDRPPSAEAIARGLRASPATIARPSPVFAEVLTREGPNAPIGAEAIPVDPRDIVRAPSRSAPSAHPHEQEFAGTLLQARSIARRRLPSLIAFALPIALASACLFTIAIGLGVARATTPLAAIPVAPPPAPTPAPNDEEALIGGVLRMLERQLGVPSGARAPVSILTIDPPRLDGALDASAIAALIDRARPAIGACSRAGSGDDVAVQVIASAGSPTIVQPQPFYPSTDPGVATCAANAIAQATSSAPLGEGVAAIAMRLPPR